MKLTPLFLLLLAVPAAAQENPYANLALGDRVQITFRSGNAVTGTLIAVTPDPSVKVEKLDYTKEKALTIDLSWEYPGINGAMTVPKDQIVTFQKLQKLDDATLRRLMEEKEKVKQQLERDDEARKKAEAERDDAAQKEVKKAAAEEKNRLSTGKDAASILKNAENMAKGLELVTKFPPEEWGPQKLKDFQAKIVKKLPLTAEEREFLNNYDLWQMGKRYQDQKKAAEKKEAEKKEEAKTEETKP